MQAFTFRSIVVVVQTAILQVIMQVKDGDRHELNDVAFLW